MSFVWLFISTSFLCWGTLTPAHWILNAAADSIVCAYTDKWEVFQTSLGILRIGDGQHRTRNSNSFRLNGFNGQTTCSHTTIIMISVFFPSLLSSSLRFIFSNEHKMKKKRTKNEVDFNERRRDHRVNVTNDIFGRGIKLNTMRDLQKK